MPKKVLYLHQYFQTNEQAGSTRSYEFAKFLASSEYEVTVITGKDIQDIDEEFDIISVKTKYSNKMSFTRRIISFLEYNIKAIWYGIKTPKVDIIFATSTPLTIAIPALILQKIKKSKFIFEVRDVWPDIPIQLGIIKNKLLIHILKKLEMHTYHKADKIIALSKGMYSNIIQKGIEEEKVDCITNISNIDLHKKYSEKKDELKKALGYEGKFLCVHPGAIGFANGLDFLLDTAKFIKDKDILFLIIGKGKEKQALSKRIIKEDVKNVILLDAMPKKEVIKYFAMEDIGLVLFRPFKILEDNSANKFFDHLAAGKPVLINYGGWQKEAILKYSCGLSQKTPEKMAQTIEALKKDRGKIDQLGKNALQLAEEHSLESAKTKLQHIFDNLYEIEYKKDF